MLRVLSKPSILMKTRQPRQLILCTAVTAFSSTSQAWMIATPSTSRVQTSHPLATPRATLISPREASSPLPWSSATTSTTSRLYSSPIRRSNNNKNDDEDDSFLGKLGKSVKSALPTKWFGTDEEKKKLARKQQVKDDFSSGIDQMLKDAPLGVRMMGKMVSPLIGSVASTMAETMAEQQQTVQELLDDARGHLVNDPAVTSLLGTPIQVGTPFQQSSSSSSINGQTQIRVELGFPVNGPNGSGVARLSATGEGISNLLLECGGRLITVRLVKSGFSSSNQSFSSSSSQPRRGGGGDDDGIIEAEIIEKNTK